MPRAPQHATIEDVNDLNIVVNKLAEGEAIVLADGKIEGTDIQVAQ